MNPTTNQENTMIATAMPPSPSTTPPSHSTSRRAWIVVGSLFSVVALTYGVVAVLDQLSFGRDAFDRTFTEQITTVEIHNDAGPVRIEGTTTSDIDVAGSIRRGLRAPSHSETITGDRLVIRGSCPSMMSAFCNLSLTVRVPAGTDVFVRDDGGSIQLLNISGNVDASSSGGGVRVTGSTGALRLRASGGGITGTALQSTTVDASSSGGGVRLSFATAPSSVIADSSGGGVTVEVPNTNEAYQLHVSSSGGSVSTPVRSDPASSRIVDAHSSGGGVTVRYPS